MSGLMSNYFGALDKSSCVYFLIISVLFFVLLVIATLTQLLWIVKNFKQLNFRILSKIMIIFF